MIFCGVCQRSTKYALEILYPDRVRDFLFL